MAITEAHIRLRIVTPLGPPDERLLVFRRPRNDAQGESDRVSH
jgi:hypothetical protein